MADRLTITGEHIGAANNLKAEHTIYVETTRFRGEGTSGEQVSIKGRDAAGKASDIYVEITDGINGMLDGTIYDCGWTDKYGYVGSAYTALDATISIMLNGTNDYVPAAGDVFGIADDHIGTNVLYVQIQSVVDTDSPIYVITPENVLTNSYAIGAPVVFNPWPKTSGDYYRQLQGIANQLAAPSAAAAIAWVNATKKVTWTACTDKAVLYSGCVLIYASDTAFTPKNWRRIDGIYPDSIVAGNLAISGAITTRDGGVALGTGTRYFLVLFCANITAADAANAVGKKGLFGAILSPFHATECSGTIT